MFRRFLLGIAVLSLASVAWAGVPDLNLSTAVTAAPGSSVFSLPSGAGAPLASARAFGGGVVDATITLTLVDSSGDPIFLYPFDDMWLESSDDGLVYCSRGTAADGSTDIDGQTTWATALQAGGHTTDGAVCLVMIAGAPLATTLDLRFNSADINGDLVVDLVDVSLFAPQVIGAGSYSGDFNFDGIVDLVDVSIFAPVVIVGSVCPGD